MTPPKNSEDPTIRILHVDDDRTFTELAATFLKREDERFDIETATSAKEGLSKLEDNRYDCIVSDYDMPHQNGIEFLKHTRQKHPDIPFILYTGKGSEEVASDAIYAGVTDYLQKETTTEQYTILANRIQNAVHRQQIQNEIEHTKNKIRDVTNKHEQTIKRVTDAIVEVDSNWKFTLLNEQAEELYNMSQEDLLGEDFWDIFESAKDTEFETEYRKVMETREPTSLLEHFPQLDGWFDIGAYPKENGGIAFYFTEVTEQQERLIDIKKQEQTLRKTKERLEIVLSGTETGIWEWKIGTNEIEWNNTLENIFGIKEGSFEGTYEAFANRVHPDDLQDVEKAMDKAIEQNELYHTEFRMIHDDGELVWAEVQGIVIEEETGPDRLLGLYHEITDRKQKEEQLEMFASVVSHDLRNQLSIAEGYLDLLQQECNSENLAHIENAHNRMNVLIEDLLTLAKGDEPIEQSDNISLSSISKDCWNMVETKNATLNIIDDLQFKANESRLQRLFENIFRNAIEHGDENITVSVGRLENKSGFYISDNGPGIPPEERECVFESGYTTNKEGTGFGLAIVSSIVNAHEWDIQATESENGGTRFEISGVKSI